MIVIHHLENSRSQRVLWLLEELSLDYEIKIYARDPVTMLAPDELRQVHPLGKSPVIVDKKRTLAESGAIIEYLVNHYGGGALLPGDIDERLRYTYWMHYAEGSLMPLLLLRLVFDRLGKPPMPLLMRPAGSLIGLGMKTKFIQPRIEHNFDFIEKELDGREWFAGGTLTAADIQLCFPLEAAAARGLIGDDRPNLVAFLKRCHDRPAYQTALDRGGPYDYAGIENND